MLVLPRQHGIRTTPAAIRVRPPQPAPAPAQLDIAGLLAAFAPISLAEMDGVALQDRLDTKYVLRVDTLARALAALAPQYRVLAIDGLRLQRYHTLYFDTPDFALYRQHHDGRRNRCKVRSRCYVDTQLSCLEVKLKAKLDRTVKQRVRTPEFVAEYTPAARRFVQPFLTLDAAQLQPVLDNDFRRITLVNVDGSERLTLDLDLRFGAGARQIALPGVVIAEVKQGTHGHQSPFVRLMRAARQRPSGFSKYCIGVSLLYPTQKQNAFKSQQRLLGKLMGGTPNESA